MKSKEELKILKQECQNFTQKINELTKEELKEVSGGTWDGGAGWLDPCPECGSPYKVLSITPKRGNWLDFHVKCKNPECGHEWSFILRL